MNKLLSIVVPVYKVEPYINKCLDSLVLADEELMNQLEVIIVNDGTPDNSAEMSREYVKRYPQTFRQIDKENGGHGSAWNVGLKEATGKYLRFLDSDDWLSNLEVLMDKLKELDVDVVVTALSTFDARKGKSEISFPVKKEGTELSMDSGVFNAAISNFWYSTYKTSLLKPLHPLFLEGVSYDDTILCIVPHICAKSFIAFEFTLYNYYVGREGQSTDLKVVERKLPDYFKNYQHMLSFIEKTCDGVADDFVSEVLLYFRWKLFKVVSIISDYEKSTVYMKEVERLGDLGDLGGKQYKRYKKMPYKRYYRIERLRSGIKKIAKNVRDALMYRKND